MKSKFKNWSFRKKISVVVSIVIVITFLLITIITTVTMWYLSINRTRELTEKQIYNNAERTAIILEQYLNTANTLVLDESIQDYLNTSPYSSEKASSAYTSLQTMLNAQEDMNFASIINLNDNQVFASKTNTYQDFQKYFDIDYLNSQIIKNGFTPRILYSDHYLEKNTLSIYYPLYSTQAVNKVLGLLVINFDDVFLDLLGNDSYIINNKGDVFSPMDLYFDDDYMDNINNNSGSFTENSNLIYYQQVSDWNYYIITEISMASIYSDSLKIIIALIIITIIIILITLLIINKMISRFYKPILDLVNAMDIVSYGSIDTRIVNNKMDGDSQILANGFNSMMDEINLLVKKNQEDQRKMEKIKFNALFSQIKPHFLYNTLECIHWQAVANGEKDISTMVKALAKYYRICLSDGAEIISLKNEIEHINSYMIIQNMRYDINIDINIKTDLDLSSIDIPKMSLQPLIENAIYHGIRKNNKDGIINVNIYEDTNIYIEIEDNGIGLTKDEVNSLNLSLAEYVETNHYGINNVNQRLQMHFGKDYGLEYVYIPNGTLAKIRLPKGV